MDPEKLRVPRGELESQLRDQVRFLVGYTTSYDSGDLAAAKQIAHGLRILLHDTKRSKSLLRQLDLKKVPFLNTVEPYNPANLVSTCGLIAFRFDNPSGRRPWIVPRGDPEQLPERAELRFSDWWDMPVLVAEKRKGQILLGRKDIVLHLANQDGGSHVDDRLPRDYAELSRFGAIGILTRREGTDEVHPIGNPVLPSVRQVAHETLKTLQRAVPESFVKPYSFRMSSDAAADNPATGTPTAWNLEFVRL